MFGFMLFFFDGGGYFFVYLMCMLQRRSSPSRHGHGLPPAPPVDLWWVWIGVNAGLMES